MFDIGGDLIISSEVEHSPSLGGQRDGNDWGEKGSDAESFYRLYELDEELGRGLSSTVRRCRRISSQEEYAVKIIEKSMTEEEDVFIHSEISILKYLSKHSYEYIIQLIDTFETCTHFFLVFELATGGELFQVLTERVCFSEDQAKVLMSQILKAIAKMHELNIVHRDMKLENILLTSTGTVKVSDFGFARFIDADILLTELLGTPGYLSPELIECNLYTNSGIGYGKPVDMWACGVIMYTLLVGFPPFWSNNRITLMKSIMHGDYQFISPYWDSISEEAKELISFLLCVDQHQRLTAENALQHQWLQSLKLEKPFNARRKFKGAVLCIIAMKGLQKGMLGKVPAPKRNEIGGFTVKVSDFQPNDLYKNQLIRKALDEVTFRLYGHWVKKQNNQSRAALYSNTPHQFIK
eukprot:Nk52_evm4s174 gene=Nk52_evmTU4s174